MRTRTLLVLSTLLIYACSPTTAPDEHSETLPSNEASKTESSGEEATEVPAEKPEAGDNERLAELSNAEADEEAGAAVVAENLDELPSCSVENTIFHCNFNDHPGGISVCAQDDREAFSLTTLLPDGSARTFNFTSETMEHVFLCQFSSPHRRFTYATFENNGWKHRLDFEQISDSNYGNTSGPSYSLTITEYDGDDSLYLECKGDVIDNLREMANDYNIRSEEQSC